MPSPLLFSRRQGSGERAGATATDGRIAVGAAPSSHAPGTRPASLHHTPPLFCPRIFVLFCCSLDLTRRARSAPHHPPPNPRSLPAFSKRRTFRRCSRRARPPWRGPPRCCSPAPRVRGDQARQQRAARRREPTARAEETPSAAAQHHRRHQRPPPSALQPPPLCPRSTGAATTCKCCSSTRLQVEPAPSSPPLFSSAWPSGMVTAAPWHRRPLSACRRCRSSSEQQPPLPLLPLSKPTRACAVPLQSRSTRPPP